MKKARAYLQMHPRISVKACHESCQHATISSNMKLHRWFHGPYFTIDRLTVNVRIYDGVQKGQGKGEYEGGSVHILRLVREDQNPKVNGRRIAEQNGRQNDHHLVTPDVTLGRWVRKNKDEGGFKSRLHELEKSCPSDQQRV